MFTTRTLGFLIHGFWAGRESSIFGGLGGPGGPQNHSRRWGASPPPSGMVCWAAGAAQTPQIVDFRPAEKTTYSKPKLNIGTLSMLKSHQHQKARVSWNGCPSPVRTRPATVAFDIAPKHNRTEIHRWARKAGKSPHPGPGQPGSGFSWVPWVLRVQPKRRKRCPSLVRRFRLSPRPSATAVPTTPSPLG